MTNVERERETQQAKVAMPSLSTNQLRTLRAWYADVLAAPNAAEHEVATLRGQLVHAEIARREASGSDNPRMAPVTRGLWAALTGPPARALTNSAAWTEMTSFPK